MPKPRWLSIGNSYDASTSTRGKVCLRGHAYDGVLCLACEELRQQKPKARRKPTRRAKRTTQRERLAQPT